jgi:hypothetical protein
VLSDDAYAVTDVTTRQDLVASVHQRGVEPASEVVERIVSRVLSLGSLPRPGGDHSSVRHYPGLGRAAPRLARALIESLFGLAPSGVYRATSVTGDPVRSYRTLSPLPARTLAVCFLWHFPAGHPDLHFASTLPCGARTFLDLRTLSSPDRDHLSLSTTSLPDPVDSTPPRQRRAQQLLPWARCPPAHHSARRPARAEPKASTSALRW